MPSFSIDQIRELTVRIFVQAGAPVEHAQQVAAALADNHLAGHDSHGIQRIPQYVGAVLDGAIVPTASPTVLQETRTTAVVDGNWAFGQVAANYAADLAIEKALESQVSAVTIVRMNHTGRLALFTERGADRDIAMFMAAGSGARYTVAPFGGAAPSLGTNPVAFSVPTGEDHPVTLDFATAAIAAGKVKVALSKDEPLPPGAVVDKHGQPTTNAADYYDGGHLVPFGGHKGYALSVIAELLSGPFSGADAYTNNTKRTGGFLFAVNAAAFRSIESYHAATAAVTDRLRSVPPAAGFDRVLVPGDPEAASRRARSLTPLEIPEKTWAAVCAAADRVGLSAEDLLDGAAVGS
ncbi:Ldh family oxidoreductase [Jiangella ureilytica]|uniref:Ldh family oxidoreductase n=1 Tax=Jiangella ureilytica TaxID=2530374 RepID=A0A4R4RS14_9ACTN|nr:Ldh family oxidoreductase [Jiangella ureilytica]TDC52757.1 Ldh family oxidoreductase [Jiangella ureilytica]